MYSLDYDMVIQVLQQFRYSGEVRAHVQPHSKFKGGGHVVLVVQNGEITSCLLFSSREQKPYHNTDAVRFLSKLGVLEWELIPIAPSQPSSPLATPSSKIDDRTDFSPRRRTISQIQVGTWPVLQRSVYALSDGTHSVKQIALLLSQPITIIEQVIYDLQRTGALER